MRTTVKAAQASIVRACAVLVTCAAVSSPALQANPTESPANPRLIAWVEQTLAQNPELAAAAASSDAARARRAGAERPVYNPELEFQYERSDIDLATAELIQPLDWHGKREARERVADGGVTAAHAEYEALRERLAGELLSALADHEGRRAVLDLDARQVALLKRFAGVAQERGRAGDLGQVEVELAQLAYVEGEMAAAGDQAALAEAMDALQRITGAPDAPTVSLPQIPAEALPRPGAPGELAARHPDVWAARARAEVAGASVRRADIERRADPTIGIKGGREDNDTLIGLRLNVPLHIRNDFSAEVDAAQSESMQASQTAAQVERQTLARLSAAQQRYRALLQAWQLWERKGRGSLESRLKLLDRLWRVGELSTTDYLVQVKQSLDAEHAGLTLQRELWQGWIGWVRAAGQVQAWLGLESRGGAR